MAPTPSMSTPPGADARRSSSAEEDSVDCAPATSSVPVIRLGGPALVACEDSSSQTDDVDSAYGSVVNGAGAGPSSSNSAGVGEASDASDQLPPWLQEEMTTTDEDSSSAADSMLDRLSRRVGSFFHQDRHDRATQTAQDPLIRDTERLSSDIVLFVLGRRSDASASGDETALCLRRCVHKMLDNHALVFNGMLNRLSVDADSDIGAGFRDLADELFLQDEVTWSKIVGLFAFAARLAQHCTERGLEHKVFDVISSLSQVAVEKLSPFLRRHGGWATFCDAFPRESDYEGKIWKSLLITGFGLTLAATLLAMHH